MDNEGKEQPLSMREMVNEMDKLSGSQRIEKPTKVRMESKLLKRLKPEELREEVNKLNQIMEDSNDDKKLVEAIKDKQETKPWYEREAEGEKDVKVNPKEEEFFSQLKKQLGEKEEVKVEEKKPITPEKEVQAEKKEEVVEEALPVVPQPPKKINNDREKTMSEINREAGAKIARLQGRSQEQKQERFPVGNYFGEEKGDKQVRSTVTSSNEDWRKSRREREELGVVRTALEQHGLDVAKGIPQKRVAEMEKKETREQRIKRLFASSKN